MLNADKLTALIASQYDTQKEFCDDAGISESLLSDYLNFKRKPSIKTLRKMADTLCVDVSELIDNVGMALRHHALASFQDAFDALVEQDAESITENMHRLDTLSEAFKRVYGTIPNISTENNIDNADEEDDSW